MKYGSQWMYKIRDFIDKYLEKETEAWLDVDKEVLLEMLIESIKERLTKRALDASPSGSQADEL